MCSIPMFPLHIGGSHLFQGIVKEDTRETSGESIIGVKGFIRLNMLMTIVYLVVQIFPWHDLQVVIPNGFRTSLSDYVETF